MNKHNVLIFPSLKLKCLDKMPRVEVLQTSMKTIRKKPPKNDRSQEMMMRKVLVDYIRDIARDRIEHHE